MSRKRNVVIASLREIDPAYNVVFTPYLWGCLKSYALKFEDLADAYTFADPVWRQQDLELMMEEVDAPDVMAFSAYVWNHNNTLKLSRAVKEKYPDCLIVFGGPHVPNDASDYLVDHPWIDVCVHGEGERPFAEILRAALSPAPDFSRIPGTSSLEDGRIVVNERARRLEPGEYPSPYASAGFDRFVERLRREHPRAHVMAVLETNRGCPFGCTFCDWGMETLSKIKAVPEDLVRAEMEWLAGSGVDSIVLADANFGILRRDVGLLTHLTDLKSRYGFPRALFIAGMDKVHVDRAFEINRMIKEHGLDMTGTSVNVSLQSMSQSTLDAIDRQNLPLDRYRKQAALYSRAGYDMVIELILPLPGETLASFKEGFAELASWEAVSKIRLYPALVLPNAPMADPAYRKRWGICTAWANFEGRMSPESRDAELEFEERVIATSTMSESEHADAKAFASLVFVMEICRLLRPLRRYFVRKARCGAHDFYDRLVAWQLAHDGVLADTLRAVRAAVADHTWGVEGTWFQSVTTSTGLRMPSHKAVAFEALTHSDRFVHELARFCTDELPALDLAELADLLTFQRDTWIGPDFEPRPGSCSFAYTYDWPAFLDGANEPEPRRRATRVDCELPQEWLELGYSTEDWLERALVPTKVYAHAFCHAPAKRMTHGELLAFDSFGDERAPAAQERAGLEILPAESGAIGG